MRERRKELLTGIMDVGVEKCWKGAMAAEDDMKLASAPGFGMKSPSDEEDAAPAKAAIDDRTWQSPNILPWPFPADAEGNNKHPLPSLI
jgi:hypothetical protein